MDSSRLLAQPAIGARDVLLVATATQAPVNDKRPEAQR